MSQQVWRDKDLFHITKNIPDDEDLAKLSWFTAYMPDCVFMSFNVIIVKFIWCKR
jgi:hypothetical protein